jgi:integrase/recombinase XerD
MRPQGKGGKSRDIPVRLELQRDILAYVGDASIKGDAKDRPLIRSTMRKTKQLTGNCLPTKAVCDMVMRLLKAAGLPERLSPHSFRVTAITGPLTLGVPLEDVQYLAGQRSRERRGFATGGRKRSHGTSWSGFQSDRMGIYGYS